MHNDIQKAGLWQRIAAGILDMILLLVLATGFCWALSSVLDIDRYLDQSEVIRLEYTQRFELPEEVTQQILDEMTAEEYQIKSIDGKDFLFVQHKSGDYFYGGITPHWYVFERKDD